MQISFAAAIVDPDYSPVIDTALPKTELNSVSRRVSRVATLDGGSVIIDSGAGESDRTLRVEIANTPENKSCLYSLQRYFGLIVCCCEVGSFLGAISDLAVDGNKITVTYIVESRLDS